MHVMLCHGKRATAADCTHRARVLLHELVQAKQPKVFEVLVLCRGEREGSDTALEAKQVACAAYRILDERREVVQAQLDNGLGRQFAT